MLQTTVMPHFSIWGVMPDLMLLVVISWSLLRGSKEGLIWALGGGLMLDLLSGGPFGTASLALVLSSLAVSLGELNLFRGAAWLPVAAAILATGIYDVSYTVFLQVFGYRVLWASGLLPVVAPSMALNALAMYPTYYVMRWLHQRTSSERIEW